MSCIEFLPEAPPVRHAIAASFDMCGFSGGAMSGYMSGGARVAFGAQQSGSQSRTYRANSSPSVLLGRSSVTASRLLAYLGIRQALPGSQSRRCPEAR
jgi:hypothetical protein